MSARLYVPATRDLLAGWAADGEVPASAERYLCPDEDEMSEYLALAEAADASATLLAAAGRPGRRMVLVAQVRGPEAADGSLPRRTWVAVHADTADDADPEEDLAWFATQELETLL